jgi:4-hydroxy-3-polyprenylbenzoate decarboxylase
LPPGFDELLLAGFLRKAPVEVVRCKTVDLVVPAHAEIILEGYVDVTERRTEGPFGDHTGFYSPAQDYPVFHLTCITCRKNPIYPATVVGRPPMEDVFLAKATERIFLPLLQMQIPEIVDLHLPLEGVFHNCAIVSIRKSYPGQARKVMSALWGLGQLALTKVIIVVDEDVDVQNLSQVAWKVFNNIDPERDFLFIKGPVDVLDHASSVPGYGSKVGIDATRKMREEGYEREWPEEIRMDEEIKRQVDQRWQDYGLD